MSRNIVQINEIRRFEKSDKKQKQKKEIFKLRSFAHEVKREAWEDGNPNDNREHVLFHSFLISVFLYECSSI